MTTKTPKIDIDGKSIGKSVTGIIDAVKYRKYAKEGYVTVFFVNQENSSVRILDGKREKETLSIRGMDKTFLISKTYLLPTKKLVTTAVFVKADCNTTLDYNVVDVSALTPELLNKFTNIKLMEEFDGFNMGQVLLGALIGVILGAAATVFMLMMYQAM